jgi:hypothetical protein
MTSTDVKPRSLFGKLLLAAGIGLFALWAYYFVTLVRPTDVWDLCPLPVALAVILLGIRFAGLRELLLAHTAVSYKRDLALALALGTLVEVSLWALDVLQEPGLKIGLALFRYSYSHLGVRLDPYAVSVGVLLVYAAIWSSAAFALLRTARLLWTRDAEPAR